MEVIEDISKRKIYLISFDYNKNVFVVKNISHVLQNSFDGMLNAVKFENEIYFRR